MPFIKTAYFLAVFSWQTQSYLISEASLLPGGATVNTLLPSGLCVTVRLALFSVTCDNLPRGGNAMPAIEQLLLSFISLPVPSASHQEVVLFPTVKKTAVLPSLLTPPPPQVVSSSGLHDDFAYSSMWPSADPLATF